ncbi:hypothetical protein PAXINDRAFT_169730 [Paxillus involutus ATCC 200175]|uniref:BZIP domain-containing protein n=1 Tax=Paxillus involutus ATCC 200175 TaxID=664439 RepID=A0A0C9TFZ8_PAXIN|nr:hypothetical protein PAXINDRAFT_169730 [Paxillus involutus ATCC 200175]
MPSRGRKPNTSIPPSRLLTQQRQFRARKAQLVQDLEQRCRTLEAENVQLRRELDVLAGEPSPQLVSARCSGFPDVTPLMNEAALFCLLGGGADAIDGDVV